MSYITYAILGLTFTMLSLGHKCRQGHNSAIDGNIFGSIVYEMAALVCIFQIIISLIRN